MSSKSVLFDMPKFLTHHHSLPCIKVSRSWTPVSNKPHELNACVHNQIEMLRILLSDVQTHSVEQRFTCRLVNWPISLPPLGYGKQFFLTFRDLHSEMHLPLLIDPFSLLTEKECPSAFVLTIWIIFISFCCRDSNNGTGFAFLYSKKIFAPRCYWFCLKFLQYFKFYGASGT